MRVGTHRPPGSRKLQSPAGLGTVYAGQAARLIGCPRCPGPLERILVRVPGEQNRPVCGRCHDRRELGPVGTDVSGLLVGRRTSRVKRGWSASLVAIPSKWLRSPRRSRRDLRVGGSGRGRISYAHPARRRARLALVPLLCRIHMATSRTRRSDTLSSRLCGRRAAKEWRRSGSWSVARKDLQ